MSTTPPPTVTDPASREAFVAPDHSFHELTIARVIEETADARSFVFEIPPHLADTFRYVAGQFLTVECDLGQVRLKRCYSLSSSPDTDGEHKVTVKRVAGGRVSNWMIDNLKGGETIRVLPPAGLFVLKLRSHPVTLFGGGSGVTPVLSILKTTLATTDRRVKLVYANRDRDSIIFREEIDALAARYPERLELVHRLDAEQGFLDRPAVLGYLRGWEASDFYICGPAPFMDVIESTLVELGIHADHIHVERFVSPHDPDRVEPEPTGAAAKHAAPVDARVAIHLRGESRELDCPAGKTILEAARAAGIKTPSNCEDGYCSVCRAKLSEGDVWMRLHDALTKTELEQRWVLTCQARPTSARVAVDFDET